MQIGGFGRACFAALATFALKIGAWQLWKGEQLFKLARWAEARARETRS